MSTKDIIKAWKNPRFRNGLSSRQLSLLPKNPAGEIILSDEDLKEAAGGYSTVTNYSCSPTPNCCPSPTCQ
jgi:mersacidin/lichenicidin family type 2 lantibiotic